jgi:hypothetical protein
LPARVRAVRADTPSDVLTTTFFVARSASSCGLHFGKSADFCAGVSAS